MSTAQKTLLAPAEYLARERAAEIRSEFFRGEMFAMAPSSLAHSLIKGNLACETGNQLKDGRYDVLTSDMRVKVSATGLYTYPDIVIVCGEPELEDEFCDTLLNPRVVVEILSDSTEKYDRGTKFRHYCRLPSVQEYVLVAHDRPQVESFVRKPDDNWLLKVFSGLTQIFEYATIPAKVALAEIYHGVSLPETRLR